MPYSKKPVRNSGKTKNNQKREARRAGHVSKRAIIPPIEIKKQGSPQARNKKPKVTKKVK